MIDWFWLVSLPLAAEDQMSALNSQHSCNWAAAWVKVERQWVSVKSFKLREFQAFLTRNWWFWFWQDTVRKNHQIKQIKSWKIELLNLNWEYNHVKIHDNFALYYIISEIILLSSILIEILLELNLYLDNFTRKIEFSALIMPHKNSISFKINHQRTNKQYNLKTSSNLKYKNIIQIMINYA